MTASIEFRSGSDECGYVYTKRTRMGFSPKFTVTRNVADRDKNDTAIWSALHEAEPHRSDVHEVVAALAARFPDRRIYADTAEGLVLVHSLTNPEPEPEPTSEAVAAAG